jgi:hypothetical protein
MCDLLLHQDVFVLRHHVEWGRGQEGRGAAAWRPFAPGLAGPHRLASYNPSRSLGLSSDAVTGQPGPVTVFFFFSDLTCWLAVLLQCHRHSTVYVIFWETRNKRAVESATLPSSPIRPFRWRLAMIQATVLYLVKSRSNTHHSKGKHLS